MKHHSNPTRSFVALVLIILVAILIAMVLFVTYSERAPKLDLQPLQSKASTSLPNLVDTKDWTTYQDKNFPLKMRLPEDWDIDTQQKIADLYTISISPSSKESDMRIFINNKSFVGLAGLDFDNFTTQNNYPGITIDNSIYGVKAGEYFYTFDATLNPAYRDEFYTAVNSAEFK